MKYKVTAAHSNKPDRVFFVNASNESSAASIVKAKGYYPIKVKVNPDISQVNAERSKAKEQQSLTLNSRLMAWAILSTCLVLTIWFYGTEENGINKSSVTEKNYTEKNLKYSTKNNFDYGRVDYNLVLVLKNFWRDNGYKYKSATEQGQGLGIIYLTIRSEIVDPNDQKATIDYISKEIGTW